LVNGILIIAIKMANNTLGCLKIKKWIKEAVRELIEEYRQANSGNHTRRRAC